MSKRKTRHIEAYNTGTHGTLVINRATRQWLWTDDNIHYLIHQLGISNGGLPLSILSQSPKDHPDWVRICL